MSRIVLLDAGPLSWVTHPRPQRAREAALWLKSLLDAGVLVHVPEIADYEVRRELLRAGKTESIARLDRLAEQIGYLPLTTEALRLAARFWADARNQGQSTASDESIDADVILAAQAKEVESEGRSVTIATTNPRHLSRFVDAKTWQEIAP